MIRKIESKLKKGLKWIWLGSLLSCPFLGFTPFLHITQIVILAYFTEKVISTFVLETKKINEMIQKYKREKIELSRKYLAEIAYTRERMNTTKFVSEKSSFLEEKTDFVIEDYIPYEDNNNYGRKCLIEQPDEKTKILGERIELLKKMITFTTNKNDLNELKNALIYAQFQLQDNISMRNSFLRANQGQPELMEVLDRYEEKVQSTIKDSNKEKKLKH